MSGFHAEEKIFSLVLQGFRSRGAAGRHESRHRPIEKVRGGRCVCLRIGNFQLAFDRREAEIPRYPRTSIGSILVGFSGPMLPRCMDQLVLVCHFPRISEFTETTFWCFLKAQNRFGIYNVKRHERSVGIGPEGSEDTAPLFPPKTRFGVSRPRIQRSKSPDRILT